MEGEVNPDGSKVYQWKLANIQVKEDKCLARIFPLWAAGILSLISMAQQGTFTVSQALKMGKHLGPKFQIPAEIMFVVIVAIHGKSSVIQVGSVAVFILRHKDVVAGGKEDLLHIAHVIALNMVAKREASTTSYPLITY